MFKQRVWLWLILLAVLAGAVSISKYRSVMRLSREAVLETNLAAMRTVIHQYIQDRQGPPQSLQDLVNGGYFRQLPTDPMTNSNSSWKPVIGDVVISAGKVDRGITDVHSGSSSMGSNGTTYGMW